MFYICYFELHNLSFASPLYLGIIVSGMEQAPEIHPSLVDIVANADSVDALLWSAAAASAVAMIMYGTCQKIMNLEKLVAAWTKGFCESKSLCI